MRNKHPIQLAGITLFTRRQRAADLLLVNNGGNGGAKKYNPVNIVNIYALVEHIY